MSGSQTDLILVVVFALSCFSLAALLMKPLIELWRRREEYWFVNRHPSVTWLLITNLFLHMAATRPLKVYYEYLLLNDDTKGAAFIAGFVHSALDAPVFHGLFLLYCTRYWLMYFDIQIAVRCSDQRWKELLLTAPETDCQHAFDWFTAHKLTLGSWNYLKKLDAVAVLAIFIVIVFTYWFATSSLVVIQSLVFLAAVVFVWRVTVNTPSFLDSIKARDEYIMYLKLGLPCGFLAFAFVGLKYFNHSFLTEVLLQSNNSLGTFLQLWAILLWTPKQFSRYSPLNSMTSKNAPLSDLKSTLLLSHILAKTDGFRVFMEHLFTEFSYENLLCCVELLQFRQLCKAAFAKENDENEGEDADDENEDEYSDDEDIIAEAICQMVASKQRPISFEENYRVYRFQFPPQILELSPTISSNASESFQRRFQQLFDKYISPSAPMPVNLSFAAREKLANGMDDAVVSYKVFDDAIVELYRIMNDSYSRFVLTDTYSVFAEHFSV